MYLEEKVDKILQILECGAGASIDGERIALELIQHTEDISAEMKLKIIEALGFRPSRARHAMGCASLQGDGLICTCVIPETVWEQPEDVTTFRHETRGERKEETRRRMAAEGVDEFDAARWELHMS